ncbi:MAG: YdeI/OmpD-associated family protein [Mucilaginibacter sp.]
MNPKADFFFNKAEKWQKELERLRTIPLDCGLDEEVKWGCPCYTYNGANIVLIHAFKDYCAYLFFKGALLKDTHSILIQQTENVQSPRQVRFTGEGEIIDLESTLKAYIFEAIEVEKAGLKVELKKTREFPVADEFQSKLNAIPALKTAFEALTPGRQRGYLLHFAQPKQSKTREARVEKYIPQILAGKGLDD